jgi:protease IV
VRLDRILVLALIAVCLVAAIGNWLGRGPTPQMSSSRSSTEGGAEIALLNVYGTISDEASTGPFSATDSANSNALIRAIRQARRDNVKAILLHINSPGGTAAASQAVYSELMRVRKETDIKIVASLGDVAASGGYYIASAAEHIMANPASLTGSIGVIVQNQNVSSLLDRIGVQTNTIKSGQYKDILSPFRETSANEQEILQAIVMDSYQQFLDAIVAGRKIPLEKLRPLADGRIFTGRQARQLNLVDSLGNFYDARQKAAELAGIKGEPAVRNYTSPNLRESLGLFLSTSLQQWIPGYSQARLVRWNKIPLALRQ